VLPTIRELEDRYGPDKLRVVWKHEPLPFHKEARGAAEAAQGVFALGGNDAFWSFVDAAYVYPQELNAEAYDRWAAAAGVDLAKLHDGLRDHTWSRHVDADHELAKKVGVNGTPDFFINGVQLGGAQPLDKFIAIVDAQLARAKEREAKGTPRARLYAELSTASYVSPGERKTDEQKAEEDSKTVWKVPLGKSPFRGPATALVTIVEFGDFQCPFTKRVEATLEKIRSTYGDQVRIVWNDEPLPFHPRAAPAAELAREARAQKGGAPHVAAPAR
jgi:protein-disulfide isomerase